MQKDLINRLSEQLRRGWNPWIERESALSYVFIDDAIEHFFRIQKNIWMMTLSEKLLCGISIKDQESKEIQ